MYINISKQSSTHLPALIKLVQASSGPVLEFGSGVFSTPVLHWLCAENKRKLITYENNLDFFQFSRKFRSSNHKVKLIDDWEKVDTCGHWGVILIDHEPVGRRGKDALKFKDIADYIVLHDSNFPEQYGYDKLWKHFKYRKDFVRRDASTTVLSNFKDLSNLD